MKGIIDEFTVRLLMFVHHSSTGLGRPKEQANLCDKGTNSKTFPSSSAPALGTPTATSATLSPSEMTKRERARFTCE